MTAGEEVDPDMAEAIHKEVERILEESYKSAKKTLEAHSNELEALVEALMKHETLDADAIKAVIAVTASDEDSYSEGFCQS